MPGAAAPLMAPARPRLTPPRRPPPAPAPAARPALLELVRAMAEYQAWLDHESGDATDPEQR